MPREDYIAFRASVNEVRVEQLKSFDSAILGLSTAALGFSITLIEFMGDRAIVVIPALISSWVFFVFSIMLNVWSYFFSARAAERLIKSLDESYIQNKWGEEVRNFWDVFTRYVNLMTGLLFVAGTVSLLVFTYYNATGVKNVSP